MSRFKLTILLAISILFSLNCYSQESKQKLYRIYADDFSQIKNIEEKGVTVFNSKLDTYIEVMAYPDQIQNLGITGIKIEFIANNFKELVGMRMKTGSYTDYHNHQETIDLLDDFSKTFPEITKLDTIGYSVLGRAIVCLKISDNPNDDEDEIPILIPGTHHGNEVLGVEATLYQIDFLLNNYNSDPEVARWIDNMEIWYVPIVNPDGREALRRTNDNSVDLNRNYSFGHTASENHGYTPFSEPETQAIRDLAAQFPPVMSLSYHTSGRLVLLPWTHTDEAAPDSVALTYLGNKIAESITFPQGSSTGHYELRQGGDWYFTAGEYCDYMYATHNTQAYTVEMFTSQTPPAENIPPVIERNLEGMKTLLRQAFKAGVTGNITDKLSGLPLVAKIDFPIFDKQGKLPDRFSDQLYGRYYRYLAPDTYLMEISAPGYRKISREITISEDSLLIMNIEMEPSPDLQVRTVTFSDESGDRISGNGDGLINIGEIPGLSVTLYNDQSITAQGTYAKVSCSSSYVEFISDSLYFGTIAHYSELKSSDTILFKLKPDCPDGEEFEFFIYISDEVGFAWNGQYYTEAYTPSLEIKELIIHDDAGNQNGIFDKGETARVEVVIKNLGRQSINQIYIDFSSDDSYFNLLSDYAELSSIDIQEQVTTELDVELSDNAPLIHSAFVYLNITSAEGYSNKLKFQLDNIFGLYDEFENEDNGWTHGSYQTSSNFHDDWQLGKPQGKAGDPASAYSGENCWGTDLGYDLYMGESWNGEYQNDVYNYLISPTIDCSNMTDVGLRYMRWLNTRVSDIARIKVNNEVVWNTSARGFSDQDWTEQLIDISDLADGNPDVRITFELESNGANALGGWNIDDFLVANKLASGTMSAELQTINPDKLNCFPNPFSHSTTISYVLEKSGHVDLIVLDALGKVVGNLVSEKQKEGEYSIIWDGLNSQNNHLENGIYFIRLQTSNHTLLRSAIILR